MEINKVYHGDCLDIMPLIEDKSIDMILCDLPYGTTACKWDSIIPFNKLWDQYKRIIKDNGVIILTGSEPFSSHLRLSNLKWYRNDWVWNKVQGSNFFNLKNRPWKTHENVMVFAPNANFTFNPINVMRTEKSLKRYSAKSKRISGEIGPNASPIVGHYNFKRKYKIVIGKNNGEKHPIDIIQFSSVEEGILDVKHPTKKPLKLFRYLIKTYSNEGDIILDNTAGSGTTGVAAVKEGRNYILIEKESEYIKTINKRLKKAHEEAKQINIKF